MVKIRFQVSTLVLLQIITGGAWTWVWNVMYGNSAAHVFGDDAMRTRGFGALGIPLGFGVMAGGVAIAGSSGDPFPFVLGGMGIIFIGAYFQWNLIRGSMMNQVQYMRQQGIEQQLPRQWGSLANHQGTIQRKLIILAGRFMAMFPPWTIFMSIMHQRGLNKIADHAGIEDAPKESKSATQAPPAASKPSAAPATPPQSTGKSYKCPKCKTSIRPDNSGTLRCAPCGVRGRIPSEAKSMNKTSTGLRT